MKNEFVNYKQSLALKSIDFDEPCIAAYFQPNISEMKYPQYFYSNTGLMMGNEACTAPLKQQVFRWFRERYDLFGCIDLQVCTPSHWFIRIDKIEMNDYIYHSEDENVKYDTYEEAQTACIYKLIELAKSLPKTDKQIL